MTPATQTRNDQPKVVIVVPTYNEIDNLPVLFDRLSDLGIPGMLLLVVDDNSPDGTGELADRLAAENPGRVEVLHRPGKAGLGRAYVHGLGHALELGADHIVQMDADLSHPPECVPEMLARLRDVDVVTASRYAPGGGVDPTWSLSRKLISRLGSLGIRLVLGLRVRDATAGFKAYRRAHSKISASNRSSWQDSGFSPKWRIAAKRPACASLSTLTSSWNEARASRKCRWA